MIDLHSEEFDISIYSEKYSYLSPPLSPGFLRRMDAISIEEMNVLEAENIDYQAWLNTPDYGIDESARKDRASGAMLGLAIGDAIGTTLEFSRRDSGRVDDLVGGGPFRLRPGEWTDDTTMSLCLADSILETGKLSSDAFAKQLIRWYRYGHNSVNGWCFDIGNATRGAIERLEQPGSRWQGSSDPKTAGNGSLVREAPLAIAYRKSLLRLWSLSGSQSHVTHGAGEAVNACELFGMLLSHALNGGSREDVLAPKVARLLPRLRIINAGEYKEKSRDQIRSSGYVIDTLEAALWSVWNTTNFRDAVLLAANLGDDSDSVAAVAGQLAGALYGLSGIPADWVEKVAWSQAIQERADRLFDLKLS